MSSRIDLVQLTDVQRQAAAHVVAAASEHMHWERLEVVFRSLARAEWMVLPKMQRLQGELPMHVPTLLRNERVMATAIVLALHIALEDEQSAEQVIAYLAQRGAALDALFSSSQAADTSNVVAMVIKQQQALT